MKINLLSLLPNESNKLNAVISAFFTVMIFIIMIFITTNFWYSLLISVCTSFFTFIWVTYDEKKRKKRHHKILKSNSFKELIFSGFKIEEKNQYKGLTGIFKEYIFDIYYDCQSYKSVTFNVYYESSNQLYEQTDFVKLERLNAKYKPSTWGIIKYRFYWREGSIIMENYVGFKNLSHNQLLDRMTIVVNILKDEGFKPINRNTLEEWRKQYPMYYTPLPELYYEEN